jgi:glycine dehydrogenase subunit 2
MKLYDKLIFELSREGHIASRLPASEVPKLSAADIFGTDMVRTTAAELPSVTESEVVRHYTNLSHKNYGLDSGFYPLGSCTMKYNPKLNETAARMAGLADIHPHMPTKHTQGALKLMHRLSGMLCEVAGLDDFTLQPAAGAHGELAGLMIIKAYHAKRGESHRTKIIVPDSAHGTNPSSAAVAGFEIVEIKSNPDGSVNIEALKAALGSDTAGLMLTNPSTLGLFEKNIVEVAQLVHEAGGQLYYDGANLNAIMGITRPGDMGFDVMHINLHKTFSTPHGGGGPGGGPVGVKKHLIPFLPVPVVEEVNGAFELNYDKPDSIGRMKGFTGNFLVLVRAYAYILTMGGNGLQEASEMAVLNANYIKEKLKGHYLMLFDQNCMHEMVFAGLKDKTNLVPTLDVAKRLLDFGYHPPTIYFPMIVDNAIMIEPTETESLETIDAFCDAMIKIAEEAKADPMLLRNAPYTTLVRRVDEVQAAKNPILKYSFGRA